MRTFTDCCAEPEIQERLAHYEGPNRDPTGVKLYPRFLGRGAYALMASRMPRDDSGVVFGSRGALVIDAGINGEMARHIQDRVRKLTDKPILYLVNTNYHGDHTFGNSLEIMPFPVRSKSLHIARRLTA
jgi:hypothetical protein